MIYQHRPFLTIMPILFAIAFAANTAHATGSGLVTIIKGDVSKQIVSGNWHGVKEREKILTGERVRTFESSLAEIIIHQTQTIRLGPETTVDFKKVFADGEKTISNLDLMEGDLWAEMDKLDDDSSFEINSKLAHATVRGTIFSLHADKGKTTLNVYRGSVEVNGQQKQHPSTASTHHPREVSGPKEVAGPNEIPGPKEVSLKEWIQIVHAMQQIVIRQDGSWQVRDIAQREQQQAEWQKWAEMLHDH